MISLPNPKSETFAEFCATADARNTLELNVRKWCLMLCDALEQNYIETAIRRQKFFSANQDDNTGIMNKVTEQRIEEIKNGDHNTYVIDTGRKYHKIVMESPNHNRPPSRSVHAFVDKKTGEVYMAASYKAPAKNGVRFDLRIIEQREWVLENCDWAGGYLYKR